MHRGVLASQRPASPTSFLARCPRSSNTRGQPTCNIARATSADEFYSSIALHDFFLIDIDGDVSRVADGIARILLKPKQLRALEIHITGQTAQSLKDVLEGTAGFELPDLHDITISVEIRFLLKYTPNVRRLSNGPREGYGYWQRNYPFQKAEELVALCSKLRKLEVLDLHDETRSAHFPGGFLAPKDQHQRLTLMKSGTRGSSTSNQDTTFSWRTTPWPRE